VFRNFFFAKSHHGRRGSSSRPKANFRRRFGRIDSECAESHHCHGLNEKYAACVARVEGGAKEVCVEEFFDFMVFMR
jgi:hypothetical protein